VTPGLTSWHSRWLGAHESGWASGWADLMWLVACCGVGSEGYTCQTADCSPILQFRRFVGCPICNTHIGQMMKRAEEIKSAGIHQVIFFHSREEEMQPLQQGVPRALARRLTTRLERTAGCFVRGFGTGDKTKAADPGSSGF
jgi:hypothetical protein